MIVNRICQSSDVSADFTGCVESLMEFYQRLLCYDLVVRNFSVTYQVQRKLKAMLVVEDFLV